MCDYDITKQVYVVFFFLQDAPWLPSVSRVVGEIRLSQRQPRTFIFRYCYLLGHIFHKFIEQILHTVHCVFYILYTVFFTYFYRKLHAVVAVVGGTRLYQRQPCTFIFIFCYQFWQIFYYIFQVCCHILLFVMTTISIVI